MVNAPTLEKPKITGCRVVVYEIVHGKTAKSKSTTVYGATPANVIDAISRAFSRRRRSPESVPN